MIIRTPPVRLASPDARSASHSIYAVRLPVCLSARLSASRHVEHEQSWTSAVAQTDISSPACRLQALAYKQPPLFARQRQQGARWPGAVCVSDLCLPGRLFLLIERHERFYCYATQHHHETHFTGTINRSFQRNVPDVGSPEANPETHRRHYGRRGRWTSPTLGAKSRRREASARNILAGR